jgi:hypothetical protein
MSISDTANASEKKTPDQIRAEIDATRGTLGYDVDALADKVDPSQIAHRQVDKVKSRFTGVKESIMGTVHDKAESVGSGIDGAKDAGHGAAQKVTGNPLAVGLVAFGAGWLVSSLIPSSDKEQEIAGQVKEQTAPLVEEVKGAAQDVAQNLKDPARDAAASVKDAAQEAAGTVKEETQSAAADVKSSAQESTDAVQNS